MTNFAFGVVLYHGQCNWQKPEELVKVREGDQGEIFKEEGSEVSKSATYVCQECYTAFVRDNDH